MLKIKHILRDRQTDIYIERETHTHREQLNAKNKEQTEREGVIC